MKRLVGVVQIIVRSLQIFVWGIYAVIVFAVLLPVEAVRSRRLDNGVALRAGGRALRVALERLGATFIKLGQVASTRPDLVPPEILKQLVRLQEGVPPFSYKQVRQIIEEDFGTPLERLFSEFEPRPLAAASVAQVHRARIAGGGQPVAVKVRRPSIAAWARLDQSIAMGFAHLLHAIPTLHVLSPVLASANSARR